MRCTKRSIMKFIYYMPSEVHKEVVVDIYQLNSENGNFSDRSLTRKEIVSN